MKILLSGIKGAMGMNVLRCCDENHVVAAGVDINADGSESIPTAKSFDAANADVDVIIDFSHHAATNDILAFAEKNGLPLVLATTGQTPEEKETITKASGKIPLFFAANYSVGVAALIRLAKQAAKALPGADIEIVETHHNRKIDAPSGTALAIAEGLKEVLPDAKFVEGRSGYCKREKGEIGINSIRMGNIVGIHEVIIGTNTQTITLKHEAHDRALFAEGALAAADFLMGKPAGLYNMENMLGHE